MNRYRNIENDEVLTEDELREEYETRKRNGDLENYYDTFKYWLSCCLTINNGSLERIAPDYEINRLRRDVANDIACDEMPYGEVLDVLQQYDVFGNWTEYEINHRPVDVEELSEMVYEELRGRKMTRNEQDIMECWDEDSRKFDWERYQELCDIAEYWDIDD